jgi:hypothetical protein
MSGRPRLTFLLIASLAESLITFRGPLIAALQAKGIQVHVAAPDLTLDHSSRLQLEARGITVHSTPMHRTGTSPLSDLKTFLALLGLIRKVRPHFVLAYTIKPVIYGSLASWLLRVPRRFALITGLGYAFQGEGQRRRLQALVELLYMWALYRVHVVFFQNPDDELLFRQRGILRAGIPSCLVNGSGVDLCAFCVVPLPF